MKKCEWNRQIRAALLTGSALLLPQAAFAQDAPAADEPAIEDGEPVNEIVVTGFRESLQAALNVKKNAVAAVDVIVAEDIAKFPDQNLAESLQRVPGISIQRDGGEGRAITVRGLGAQFTRVRVNGLETIATSTDGASSNRDRAFDFNVFASELFSSIVVHKTAEASLDEGSLGAVVDLNTGNPLAGKAGLTGALSLVGSYNDLSDNVGPRVAGLLSWRNDAGTIGASVSAAYSKTDTLELGNNTVRWAQARFDSVNGTPCFYSSATSTTPSANSGGVYRSSAACDQAALAFHPRIPRYGEIGHDRERLGLTGSLQFAPTDSTTISLDGLYSSFKEDREEKWGEVLLRSLERSIDVVNPTYDTNGNMISATLNDAYVRTEHYLRQSETEFYQFGGRIEQDFGDSFRVSALGGLSKSNADIPVETTIVFDDRDSQGYKYDYTNMAFPVLTFGTPSVSSPSTFQLAEIRDRPSNVTNRFKTAQLRAEWDVADGFTVKMGGVWRRFDFASRAFQRDTAVCGNGGTSLVTSTSGTITCSPSSLFGPTAVYGFPVTAALSELFTLGNAGQPAGTTTEWLIPNLEAATAFTGLYNLNPRVDAGNTRQVRETTKGLYLEFNFKGDLFGMEYAGNAGTRYVKTTQFSQASNGVNVTRSYDDWLPSFNVAFYPAQDLIVRGAIGKTMTRPSLGNLNPAGSVDGFNLRATFGNPYLDPYRATNFDASVEWYFAPQALLSIAGFVKKIESFPVSGAYNATLPQLGLGRDALATSSPAYINYDPNQLYTVSSQVNGTGATLKGVELAAQIPLSAFTEASFIKNFGVLANATFITSDADYTVQGPSVVPGGSNVTATRNATLFGVSKRAYNGTLYYDDGRLSARVSASYRSRYIDANSGTGNVFEGYGATTNIDASLRYKLFEWLELSVEGNNLTDEYRYRYTDFDADRNYENNHFGRTILFGARMKI